MPVLLTAGSVVEALESAEYRIVSEDEFQHEIALAHQAGHEEAREGVGS